MHKAIKSNTLAIARYGALGTLAFSAGMVFIAAVAMPSHKPQCELIAETYSGDVYVLGVGDTCRDAMRNHGPIPPDFRELKTQMSNTATRGIHIR